jgi:hypothetical protein
MSPLESAIRIVVDLLVRGEYDVVEAMTQRRRLSAPAMRDAIQTYGRTLALPPDDWWQYLDVVAVDCAEPPRYSVVTPLWTVEEGRSDLSLDLTLCEFSPGLFETIVEDIHVR